MRQAAAFGKVVYYFLKPVLENPTEGKIQDKNAPSSPYSESL